LPEFYAEPRNGVRPEELAARLEEHPAVFPFNIKLNRSELLESKHFELARQGLNRPMISLR